MLVKEKPHFVVTSNTDDHFAMAGFDRKSIFEIEGNNREVVFTMREHEQGMEIPAEYLPRCPICGGTMQIHVPVNQAFVRDKDWQAQSECYMDFIDSFHNKFRRNQLGLMAIYH